MPAGLLIWWEEFYRLNPGLHDIVNWSSAQVSAIIANANRDGKKRPSAFAMRDFVLEFDREPEEFDDDDFTREMCQFVDATQEVFGEG
ncbi:MAG: hypothetical protein U0744_02605 [Gemmataceae bacterium]